MNVTLRVRHTSYDYDQEALMGNPFKGSIIGVVALLALAATASAQNPQGVPQHPPNREEKLAAEDTGGPAPVRDLSGSYVGPHGIQAGHGRGSDD